MRGQQRTTTTRCAVGIRQRQPTTSTRQQYQYTEKLVPSLSLLDTLFFSLPAHSHGIPVLQGAEQGVHHFSTPSSEPLQCQAQPTPHSSSTTIASSLVCLNCLVCIFVEHQTTSKYRRYHRPAHRVSPSHPFWLPNSPPAHHYRDGQYGAYPLFDPNNRVASSNPLPEFLLHCDYHRPRDRLVVPRRYLP